MTINLAEVLRYNLLDTLSDTIDNIRIKANVLLDENTRGQMGQCLET
jgi:hypothetical protein